MAGDFLSLEDRTAADLDRLLVRAAELKAAWEVRAMPQLLAGARMGLIVDDGGWRNTTAFDLGAAAMGASVTHAPVSFAGREETADLAAYLDNWFDLLVVRTPSLETLRDLARAANAPVINARTRTNHPCETLGDLAFARQQRGGLEGLKVAVVSPAANILGSWIEAAQVLPLEVVQVFAAPWHDPAAGQGGFRASEDMGELADAHVIVTDRWPSDPMERDLSTYRVTAARLDHGRPDALFIPCPPVTRGQEVSPDAMTHAACRVTEAKAFLLHAQNALLAELWPTS